MLKYYDSSHTYKGVLTQYRDLSIESQTGSGDKSLSFVLLEEVVLEAEYYLQDGKDEYVIKEIDRTTGNNPVVYAALNLEELEGKAWKTFQATDSTIEAAARLAIAGTGWTVNHSDVSKKRNAGIMKKSALGVLEDLCTAFLCEIEYDTLNKTISFYESRGADRGVYFLAGLNLRQLQRKTDSYDYYTRIIPYGADGLDITSVNSGKEYLDNFQYSNKVRTYIWEDSNYTDATALKEDAAAKLADMSKPKVSYSAQIIDLARMSSKYALLDFGLGDTITLIDKSTGTKEKQRIVKLVEYPDEPERNTCELSNTSLTWEEMQARLQAAAAIVNAVIGSDGNYNGTIKVSDILHFADGVVGTSSGQNITLGSFFETTSGALGVLELEVGNLKANALTVDEADIKYATIANLNAATARISTLESTAITAEYADLHYATIDDLHTNYANITLANIDTANIAKAVVKDLFTEVGLITSATIVDGKITGYLDAVSVNAANITAGTLVADRIAIRGSNQSIVYALNNYGQITSTQTNTLDGYVLTPRTINADKIVAGTITANEIAATTITANKLNVSTLSSITANIGTVTAGVLKSSDYSYSSGNYSAAGMIIDLSNKIIRMPNTAILANGALYTKSGNIGGWSISSDAIAKVTSDGNYRVRLQAPATATTSNYAFRIDQLENNDWTNLLALTYAGQIVATKGTIAGWSLSSTAFYRTSSTFGSSAGMYFGTNGLSLTDKFRVNSSGTVYIENGIKVTEESERFIEFYTSSLASGSPSPIGYVGSFHGSTGTMFYSENEAWLRSKNNQVIISANYGSATSIAANYGASAIILGAATVAVANQLEVLNNLVFTVTTDKGIIQGYNSTTKYNILRNHGNGNVSLSACSAGLYLGYEQTTFVNFLNGKMSLNSQGHLTVTGEIHAGGSHIYFYYGTSTTVTSQLYESASGTLRVSGEFTVDGVIRVPKTWENTTTNSANVRVIDQYGQLQRYTSSSKRYKHSIKRIENYRDVLDINVVTFVYNKDYLSEGDPRYGTPIPGFIAEDVAEKYPIAADVIGGKIEDWNARYIIPPMLAVEQDHEKRIAALEAEIKALKGVA